MKKLLMAFGIFAMFPLLARAQIASLPPIPPAGPGEVHYIPITPVPGEGGIAYTCLLTPVPGTVDSVAFYWAEAMDYDYDIYDVTGTISTSFAPGDVTIHTDTSLINIDGSTVAGLVGCGPTQVPYIVNLTSAGIVNIGVASDSSWRMNLEAGSNANGKWEVTEPTGAGSWESLHPGKTIMSNPLLTSILTVLTPDGSGMASCQAIGSSLERGEDNWAFVYSAGGNIVESRYYDFDDEGNNIEIWDISFGSGVTLINREWLIGSKVVASAGGSIYMGGGWECWMPPSNFTYQPIYTTMSAVKVDVMYRMDD